MENLKTHIVQGQFALESGATIDQLEIGYHTYGRLNAAKDNVIWVFHALTANSAVLEWWPGLFGQGCLFTPEKHFIICANVIGSPYGTTQPDNLSFPQFSVRDIVKAHTILATALDIKHILVAIGGSFGGNQALEFAYVYTGKIDKLILIASCAKESAWSIAVHETQRMAMKSDKTFGTPKGGTEGMAAARAIGMLTYRTSGAFIETQTDKEDKLDDFKASSYIQYQGEKFIKRFNALSYYYLSKCLDTHNLGRDRGGIQTALSRINMPALVIGITSDLLIPPALQQEIATALPNGTYKEIASEYGHDGFLLETEKLTTMISSYLKNSRVQRAILKFGGSSLANGEALEKTLEIIRKAALEQPIALVVSARGKTTDQLEKLYERACSGQPFEADLKSLLDYQCGSKTNSDYDQCQDTELAPFRKMLEETLGAISVLGLDIPEAKDKILAQGERMSARHITGKLQALGLNSKYFDATAFIVTENVKGQHIVNMPVSKDKTIRTLGGLEAAVIPVITGYIAADERGHITTLGRNGSNYTATLIANFLLASEIQNWTDVNGVYSAHPKYVKQAKLIPHLSYREANELANFGASVLHSKTITPLMESHIPLKILNSKTGNTQGTLIDKEGAGTGIKSISLLENICLVSIEGMGMYGKVGIDSRIFSALHRNNISVRLISQASSERGIGFVIDSECSIKAESTLKEEFREELIKQVISDISINHSVAIIAITGRHNYALEKAIEGLRKNKIWVHLFSNSISGENISLVIDSKGAHRALNVVHDYVVE